LQAWGFGILWLMTTFRIEPGLPAYGPRALSFPDANAFQEGLVVTFTNTNGDLWTGNFRRGCGRLDAVRDELGPNATIVVSQGDTYCVDVDSRAVKELTGPVEYIHYDPGQRSIVLGNGLWFESINASGTLWQTPRISWDGMRSVRCDGQKIKGEAYSPLGLPDWMPFELDLASGTVCGGSYNGPP
jgi:hypothetical protein